MTTLNPARVHRLPVATRRPTEARTGAVPGTERRVRTPWAVALLVVALAASAAAVTAVAWASTLSLNLPLA